MVAGARKECVQIGRLVDGGFTLTRFTQRDNATTGNVSLLTANEIASLDLRCGRELRPADRDSASPGPSQQRESV